MAVALAVLTGFGGCASERLEPIQQPPSFPRELVAKGAELAHLGNCMGCHTAEGGKAYAGGTPIKTPFGTIYGTNITPDANTGIGRWSREAFARAMREGVDRDGGNLYPAFPYDHFTKLADEDIAALYAFLMTREPVRQENRANRVPIPRAFIGVWKSRYLERGAYRAVADRSAEWNRGAYLVQGLGHCGACHTPRNAMGAERKDAAFAGGEVEGWHAPALNSASPSPVPWTVDALHEYLRHGIADLHAMSAGPMAEVVHDLSQVGDADVASTTARSTCTGRRSHARGRRKRCRATLSTTAAAPIATTAGAARRAARWNCRSAPRSRSQLRAISPTSSATASCHPRASAVPGCRRSPARSPTSSSPIFSSICARSAASRHGRTSRPTCAKFREVTDGNARREWSCARGARR